MSELRAYLSEPLSPVAPTSGWRKGCWAGAWLPAAADVHVRAPTACPAVRRRKAALQNTTALASGDVTCHDATGGGHHRRGRGGRLHMFPWSLRDMQEAELNLDHDPHQ